MKFVGILPALSDAMQNMLYRFIFSTLLIAIVLPCGLGQQPPCEVYDFPPGREGLESMIQYLLTASDEDRRALTEHVLPDKKDYAAVFTDDFSQRVQRYHRRMRKQYDLIIKPLLPNQTDYICWETTPEELFHYTGEARNFPGGYKEIARYFQPELKLYRFKFVMPGMRLGSAYDVLVFVNGHWRIFPRPWIMGDELMRY